MASVGIKQWGMFKRVPDDHQIIKNQLYESRGELNTSIPEDIARGMVSSWRDKLIVQGITPNYVEIQGSKFTIQWKVTQFASSPGIPWGAVLYVIYEIAIGTLIVVGVYYGLTALSGVIHETGEVLSLLGPENVSMIVQILFMFMLLMFLGPFISMISDLVKGIIPKKRE